MLQKQSPCADGVCLFRPGGRAGGRARAPGPKGREPGTPASAASGARAAPGSLERGTRPAPAGVESAAPAAWRGGDSCRFKFQAGRPRVAQQVPRARCPPMGVSAPTCPQGPEMASEGRGAERPPPRSEPTARGAVRKARPWGRPWGALPHPPVGVLAVSRRAARWPLPIPRPGDPERIREGDERGRHAHKRLTRYAGRRSDTPGDEGGGRVRVCV